MTPDSLLVKGGKHGNKNNNNNKKLYNYEI